MTPPSQSSMDKYEKLWPCKHQEDKTLSPLCPSCNAVHLNLMVDKLRSELDQESRKVHRHSECPMCEDEGKEKLEAELRSEKLQSQIRELEAENKQLQDSDVVSGVLRMENKKIGTTLKEICKLLRDSGVEKRYFDQADYSGLQAQLKEAVEALTEIEKSDCIDCHSDELAKSFLNKLEGPRVE